MLRLLAIWPAHFVFTVRHPLTPHLLTLLSSVFHWWEPTTRVTLKKPTGCLSQGLFLLYDLSFLVWILLTYSGSDLVCEQWLAFDSRSKEQVWSEYRRSRPWEVYKGYFWVRFQLCKTGIRNFPFHDFKQIIMFVLNWYLHHAGLLK